VKEVRGQRVKRNDTEKGRRGEKNRGQMTTSQIVNLSNSQMVMTGLNDQVKI